ncbi:unnamed protein product [Prorocentrum cordatum]|uniref:Protein RFT1 homolog n=1 Tax=Prorocentrum cordatum TaxID=2364126 RepID=A0ABN9RTW3_9DINO|nr:unnamed protein product [Polarella glacialis]
MVPTALGRGGPAAAREVADRLSLWGWLLGVALCICQLLTLPLVPLMTPVKAVQEATRLPSLIAALLQIVTGAVMAGEGTLQGLRAYRWLACSASLGCLLMLCILALTRDLGVAGVWIGFFAFNLVRLLFSASHRLRFGPLARRGVGPLARLPEDTV